MGRKEVWGKNEVHERMVAVEREGFTAHFYGYQMIIPKWLYLYKTTYLGQITSMHHSLMYM